MECNTSKYCILHKWGLPKFLKKMKSHSQKAVTFEVARYFDYRVQKIVYRQWPQSQLHHYYAILGNYGYLMHRNATGHWIIYNGLYTDRCENVTIPIFILTLALRQDILSKNVAVMTPHNHPPIRGGGHSSNFFRKNDSLRC